MREHPAAVNIYHYTNRVYIYIYVYPAKKGKPVASLNLLARYIA